MTNQLNISITDAARLHIQTMIQRKPETPCFHLSLKKTGCNGYMYMPKLISAPGESDLELPLAGEFQFAVALKSKDLMQGTLIDFEEKQWGFSQLTFTHPKAAGICGCGESFNFDEDE